MEVSARHFKRTKMICTIGPSSLDHETLTALCQEGMNIARINASHGDHAQHVQIIETLRAVSKEQDKPLGILYDLQGPKIRCGTMPEDGVMLYRNQVVTLSTKVEMGDKKVIPLQFDFTPYLKKGDPIFINDGYVELKTLEVSSGEIRAGVVDGGQLTSHKGINLPETSLPDLAINDKDLDDLDFAISQNVDFIAVSFVQRAEDIEKVRKILGEKNSKAWIIAKIERKEALNHLEDIIDHSDGVMVARGDLAIEVGMEEVPLIQKRIIARCRAQHKPAIVATQMLESMIDSRRPTRAEVNDIATAVFSKVSALMLSAETASGHYPVEAAATMKKVIKRVERQVFYSDPEIPENDVWGDHTSAIAAAAVQIAKQLKTEMIIVGTESGATAQAVSSYRPNAPIIAVTNNEGVYRRMTILWGVKSFLASRTVTTDDFIKEVIGRVVGKGYLSKGEEVVIVSGQQPGIVGGTNMIKLHTI